MLPNTIPGITFDENGVCNYCQTYQKMVVKGEDKFIKVLNSLKNKHKKYDCMVGLSGGRDSTYTLWKLVNDYKMRVLAIHYDNPFTSSQAKLNMERAVDILGIDLIKWDSKMENMLMQLIKL